MNRIVAAIGVFDGVHKGHRKIILSAVKDAKRNKARSLVITFDPHPLKVLKPARSVPSIISTSHRLRLIRALGAGSCRVIRFNRSFARLSPRAFVEKILVRRFKVSRVFIGGNFVFGRKNAGNAALLRKLGKEYDFDVRVVPMVKAGGKVVSSSMIRRLIIKGDLAGAAAMLGRPVTISGTVISGKRRGRLLGYPTANIEAHHEAIPPSGIYAVRVNVKGRSYGGALFIGAASTFGEKESAIEVHIFGLHEFIYNEKIEVVFVKHLRGARKFSDHSKLVEQIKRDDINARRILNIGDIR